MTPSSMVSERDAVLRERAAFVAGVNQAHRDQCDARHLSASVGMYWWDGNKPLLEYPAPRRVAAERYPLPKKTVPRVVRDKNDERIEFSVRGGKLVWRNPEGGFHWWHDDTLTRFTHASLPVLATRFEQWRDLFANPTETVEDDGTEGET